MAKSKTKAKKIIKAQELEQQDLSPCPCTRVPVIPEPSQEPPPRRPSKLRSVFKWFTVFRKVIPKRLLKMKRKETTTVGPETQSLMPETAPPAFRTPVIPSRLRLLPKELLPEIAKYAGLVATACLRGTSHYFRANIPHQPLTVCAQALVIARFECDMEVLPQKVVCMLCKRRRPRKYFCPTTHTTWITCSNHNRCLGLLDRKPYVRFCADHVYQYINHEDWKEPRQRSIEEREFGVARMARMCTHCSSESLYASQCCGCRCEVCELQWQPLFDKSMRWDSESSLDDHDRRQSWNIMDMAFNARQR